MTGQVDDLLAALARWAAGRPDVQAIALVGSRARNAASPHSDVDIVVLSDDPAAYLADEEWARGLGVSALGSPEAWGAVTSRRGEVASGLEVEFGFSLPSWAHSDPVDEGTRRVVMNGCSVVYDPSGLLARLIRSFPRD